MGLLHHAYSFSFKTPSTVKNVIMLDPHGQEDMPSNKIQLKVLTLLQVGVQDGLSCTVILHNSKWYANVRYVYIYI